jgi:hypothetical protein
LPKYSRRKKEEGRRKKEEGRRKKEEGRRKKEEGKCSIPLMTELVGCVASAKLSPVTPD